MKLWILITMTILLSLSVFAQTDLGKNFEKECVGDFCSMTIYSYQKYYQRSGDWLFLNESFDTENCQQGYSYCVDNNLYQFHIPSAFGESLLSSKKGNFSYSLGKVGPYAALSKKPVINKNVITYKNIVPSVNARYTYYPDRIKEEIIIKNKRFTDFVFSDIVIEFNLDSKGSELITNPDGTISSGELFLEKPIIYDANLEEPSVSTEIEGTKYRITIPLKYFNDPNTDYPIIIDPTIVQNLTSSEDQSVRRRATTPTTYTRASLTGVNIFMGNHRPTALFTTENWRASSEWDITNITDTVEVFGLNLTYFVKSEGTPIKTIEFSRMTGNRTIYPDTNGDDCANQTTGGNCNFWTDAGNDTLYTFIDLSGTDETPISLDLDNATSDFMDQLKTGFDHIAYGLGSGEGLSASVGDRRATVRSQNAANANERPRLEVNFTSDVNPHVEDLLPENNTQFNPDDSINISANVTDFLIVDTVLVNISLPDDTSQLHIMTNISDKVNYNYTFTAPSTGGNYTYTIIANDTRNNINDTEFLVFEVIPVADEEEPPPINPPIVRDVRSVFPSIFTGFLSIIKK